MTIHALSHTSRRATYRLLWSASSAWLACIAVSFALVIFRQNFLPHPDDSITVRRLDAVTLALVVITTATVFLRGEHGSFSRMQALAVGLFWVCLSVLCEFVSRVYFEGHDAMRFLLRVMIGDSDPTGGWVWSMFLTLQMGAPVTVDVLREGFSRIRRYRMAGQA